MKSGQSTSFLYIIQTRVLWHWPNYFHRMVSHRFALKNRLARQHFALLSVVGYICVRLQPFQPQSYLVSLFTTIYLSSFYPFTTTILDVPCYYTIDRGIIQPGVKRIRTPYTFLNHLFLPLGGIYCLIAFTYVLA